ncbi:MAG: DJ-1/PfpI family protein [Chloroflexota bacterium]
MSTDSTDTKIKIGIPLYPAFDSLDVLGPYQVFTLTRQTELYLLGPAPEAMTKDVVSHMKKQTAHLDDHSVAASQGYLQSFEGVKIQYDYTYGARTATTPFPDLDIIFVPGGPEPQIPLKMGKPGKNPYINLLQDFAGKIEREQEAERKDKDRPKRSQRMMITSVCVGSLLLATAGLLDGYRATTHWAFRSILKSFPHIDVVAGYPRYVIDGNRMTGGGISSGIDQALAIVAILMGDAAAKRVQLAMQYAPNPPFTGGDPSTAEPAILHEDSSGTRPLVTAAQTAFSEFVHSNPK